MTSTSAADPDTGLTRDAFLGGRVHAWQPKVGFRSGIDAVLLAAAVPAAPGDTVLDIGCGTGVAALCLRSRVPQAQVTGIEIQPNYADLARRNGLGDIITADLASLPADFRQRQFAHVMMNPPYFDRQTSSPSDDAGRNQARGGPTALADWLETGARRLAPQGTLTVIQRADRLADIVPALPADLGSLVILPIAPRVGRDAKLILVQSIKGGRAALRIAAPLVLHDGPSHVSDGDDYSAAANALLRCGERLDLRR